MPKTLILVLFCLLANWVNAETTLKWHKWSPKVFEQALCSKRLVLLDLTAEWCQYCRLMDETTYHDPQVINVINRSYIPVRAADEKNPRLAKRYENYGRPATVIFNANGIELMKRRGYFPPLLMRWMLEAVAQNPSPDAHK